MISRIFKFLSISFLVLFFTSESYSQWAQTSSPSAIIYAETVKDNLVFVGTPMGIFRSLDYGKTWTPINLGAVNLYVSSFAVNGQNIFAGTKDRGIFRSTDNGDSWMAANVGLGSQNIGDVLVKGNTIYSVAGGNIYSSENNGNTWTLSEGISKVRTIIFKDDIFFAGTDDGIYNKIPTDSNWYKINYSLNVRCFGVSGTLLYAGTEINGVFLSTDNGKNWNAATNGIPEYVTINTITQIGSSIFAATDGAGVYFSINNGSSWMPVNNGLTSLRIQALSVYGTNLFAGTFGGLFVSRDNGNSWNHISAGISNGQVINCFSVNGNNLYAGTDFGRVFVSPDDGKTWKAYNNSGLIKEVQGRIVSIVGDINSITIANNFIYVGTDSGVYRSVDDGMTYKSISTGIKMFSVYSLSMVNNNLFAGTQTGLYTSFNDGKNWTPVDNNFANGKVTAVAMKSQNIYAGFNGNVITMVEKGKEWNSSKFGRTFEVLALATNEDYLYTGTAGGGFFRADLDGDGWKEMNEGLSNNTVTSIISINDWVIVSTYGGGVFFSQKEGKEWVPANEGLNDLKIKSMILHGNNIFIGTEAGNIYKRNLNDFAAKVN